MQRTLNVLLIDEAPTGQGFDRQLYAAGCNVVGVFGYGRQTVEHLRRRDYDVIVVVVRQPLIRSLRAVEMAALVSDGRPVVTFIDNLVSAPFQLARQVMRAGAADAFSDSTKPADLMELLWRAILVADRRRLALRGGVDEVIAPGEITVVFGAKGGTGKTTLALNLAYGQAILSDERVALLDLDPQPGGIPALLDPANFRQVSPTTLSSFLDERLADLLENHPAARALLARREAERDRDSRHILQAERSLRRWGAGGRDFKAGRDREIRKIEARDGGADLRILDIDDGAGL